MTKLMKIAAFAIPACAMVALAQPAAANGGAAAAATADVQAKAAAPKKICINVVPDTGSRMARTMCKTKAEWSDEGIDLGARK